MFENGKPNIVLKTVKGFNLKNSYYNLIPETSFKFGIVVLVMLNKRLVIVLLSIFTLDTGRDPKNPVFQFVPISNTKH